MGAAYNAELSGALGRAALSSRLGERLRRGVSIHLLKGAINEAHPPSWSAASGSERSALAARQVRRGWEQVLLKRDIYQDPSH